MKTTKPRNLSVYGVLEILCAYNYQPMFTQLSQACSCASPSLEATRARHLGQNGVLPIPCALHTSYILTGHARNRIERSAIRFGA